MLTDVDTIAKIAITALEDIKGKDILELKTDKLTSLFSRLIVVTGDSNRQVKALANHVHVMLKEAGADIVGTEGHETGEWVLVDAGDVVIHCMLAAVRDYYDIEELWGGQKPSFTPNGGRPWSATDTPAQ
jgi:ribosome-associated protein